MEIKQAHDIEIKQAHDRDSPVLSHISLIPWKNSKLAGLIPPSPGIDNRSSGRSSSRRSSSRSISSSNVEV